MRKGFHPSWLCVCQTAITRFGKGVMHTSPDRPLELRGSIGDYILEKGNANG